jgi:hypothetical protein
MAEYATLLSLSLGRMIARGLGYLSSNYQLLLPVAAGAVVLILLLVWLIKPPRV